MPRVRVLPVKGFPVEYLGWLIYRKYHHGHYAECQMDPSRRLNVDGSLEWTKHLIDQQAWR